MTRRNIRLSNDDTPTDLHPETVLTSSVDATMCSPLFMDFTWKEGRKEWAFISLSTA